MSMLSSALTYAASGRPVFPLNGKRPLTENGFKDATTDEAKIREWWTKWPDANIGMPTGAPSGWVVLDVDPRNGGGESLNDLELEHGTLDTLESVTGGGGRHLYFRHPGEQVPCRKVADGLDVKGDGGYVVVPPSVHPETGQLYSWEATNDERHLASLPPWLNSPNGHRAPAPPLPEVIRKGERNATLASIAGSMRRRGASEIAIEAALMVENNSRCEPSLPEEEVKAIARSIGRYAPEPSGPPRRGPGWLRGLLKLKDEVFPPKDMSVGELHHRRSWQFSGAELLDRPDESDELPYLRLFGETGFFVRGWSHLLVAYPKGGKTELLAWFICERLREGDSILFLSEEREAIWSRRLARLAALGVVTQEELGRLQIWCALGRSPEELHKLAFSSSETILIVDTLRSLLQPEDETDNSAMALLANHWISAATRTGKTLIMAHHHRKGAGEHGEGIAGGHSLYGCFDLATELTFDVQGARRLLKNSGRLVEEKRLVYERDPSTHSMRALGDPARLELEAVKERCLSVVITDWRPTKEIVDALGEPKPGEEQVRLALNALAHEGKVRRDPPMAAGAVHRRGGYSWALAGESEEVEKMKSSHGDIYSGEASSEHPDGLRPPLVPETPAPRLPAAAQLGEPRPDGNGWEAL